MKKTSVLLLIITIVCLVLSSCQTAMAENPVVAKPQTIKSTHYSSFGFEFDFQVTGTKQATVSYPSILSADLMGNYASFLSETSNIDSVKTDAANNALIIVFKENLTEDVVKNLSNSFEAFLNRTFDSLDAPVYTMVVDGYAISFKQVGDSSIIVDFPGIPTQDAAQAILNAASTVSPVSLEGTKIYISSSNRVLYIIPAEFNPAQFKDVVESINNTEEAPVSAPEVTSEPVDVPSVTTPAMPTVQTKPEAPTVPTTPATPAQTPVLEPAPEPVQTPKVLSPGLIMLIIVMTIVVVTCVVALVKRKSK